MVNNGPIMANNGFSLATRWPRSYGSCISGNKCHCGVDHECHEWNCGDADGNCGSGVYECICGGGKCLCCGGECLCCGACLVYLGETKGELLHLVGTKDLTKGPEH